MVDLLWLFAHDEVGEVGEVGRDEVREEHPVVVYDVTLSDDLHLRPAETVVQRVLFEVSHHNVL